MPVVLEVQMGRHFFVDPPNCYATFTYEGKEFRKETHHGATNPKWPNTNVNLLTKENLLKLSLQGCSERVEKNR